MKEVNKDNEIDYKQQIFYNKYQRQAPDQNTSGPVLEKYYVCSIDPKSCNKIMAFIKSNYQYTSENLRHLKRVMKCQIDQKVYLKIIICPISNIELDSLTNQIKTEALISDLKTFEIGVADIPMNKPFDKEANKIWSQRYWPIVWKGNPLVQELNELYHNFNKDGADKYMYQIIEESKKSENKIVALFVDPKTDSVKSTVIDCRTQNDPLNHPVMKCIDEIAQQEVNRRKLDEVNDKAQNNYLCLNYHVYITHEPCVMCAMALVHSRISQLIYLKQSPLTGGIDKSSAEHYMIHLSCTLNWKFEAYRMIHSQETIDNVDQYLNV